MTGKPIRVLFAVAAIVLAGFAVAAVSRDDRPQQAAAIVDTSHGEVKFSKGRLQRILNAVDTATSQVAADQLVAEGHKAFRDAKLFQDGESCQTCHAEGSASAKLGTMVHDTAVNSLDPRPVPTPPADFNGPRDPPALWNLDKTAPYFWDGDVPNLAAAVARPVHGHMSRFVTGDCKTSSADCDATEGRLVAALTAYIKTLDPPVTAFDRGTLSGDALVGEKLFQGKGGCIECHGGPQFTDNLEHNTGVPQVNFISPYRPGKPTLKSNDLGCRNTIAGRTPCAAADAACAGANPPAGCADVPPPNAAFVNTPQMRDLKDTAPYMHNGAFQTLKQVVQFYNTQSTVAPLNLTGPEIDDLVAYLQSL
jgi:cytochrome c peroxidase